MCPLSSVSFTVVHLVTSLLKSKISLVNRRIKTQIFCKVGNTYGDITVYDSPIYILMPNMTAVCWKLK